MPSSAKLALRDSVELDYTDTGDGPTIVFHQGFSLTQSIWRPIVDDLVQDHRCITFDPRGHGKSAVPQRGYTLERLSDDVHELADRLELTNVTLVGHSMGGAVCLNAVADEPAGEQFGRLVLLGAAVPSFVQRFGLPFGVPPAQFAHMRRDVEDDFAAFSRRTSEVFFHQVDRQMARRIFDETLSMPSEVALQLLDVLGAIDLADRLPDVAMPVLALWGAHDQLSDPRWASWLVDQRLPRWSVGTLRNSGHAPMADEPELLAHEIRKFVHSTGGRE